MVSREEILREFNQRYYLACVNGDLEKIKMIEEAYEMNFLPPPKNHGLFFASMGNHINLFSYFKPHAMSFWQTIFNGACTGGHMHIVKSALPHVLWHKYGFESACSNGHLEIAKLLLENYEVDEQIGLKLATDYKRQNIIDLLTK